MIYHGTGYFYLHLEVEPVPLMTLRNYGMSEEQQTPPKEILWVGAMWLLGKKKKELKLQKEENGGVVCSVFHWSDFQVKYCKQFQGRKREKEVSDF